MIYKLKGGSVKGIPLNLRSPFLICLLLLSIFATGGCSILLPSDPLPIPTATPDGNFVIFQTSSFRQELAPGENIPGTLLRFIRYEDNNTTFVVSIDGLSTLKKAGDSFDWEGVLAPGVLADYELTLDNLTFGEPFAEGLVRLTVLNPTPVELDATIPPPPARYIYENLDIDYRIPIGRTIPGTQIQFVSLTDNGAQLSGLSGSPFRRQNDSFLWQGRLASNVVLRYDLEVIAISDSEMRLVGTGTLWVDQAALN